jgi:hypothetical protein
MSRRGEESGLVIGLLWIVGAIVVVSIGITAVTGTYGHWVFITGGGVVGLWAMQSIQKSG